MDFREEFLPNVAVSGRVTTMGQQQNHEQQRPIMEVSRLFFRQVVLPILEREFPEETAQTAFGLFGYGSEALGLDDAYSRDHHFGLRIDALMPEPLFKSRGQAMMQTVAANLPSHF